MNEILNRILGINWRTSILGIGVIVASGSRMWLQLRSKNYDFTVLAEDGQLIVTTLGTLLGGFGLLIAKDSAVTGVGTQAKAVDSKGAVTNIEGDKVAQQPVTPPQPRRDI